MNNPKVKLVLANLGTIVLELDAEKAPLSVANFLKYVADGHYNGILFHRVIPGFMIQGGGFEPGMSEKKPRVPIENEARNGLKNVKYSVALARTQAPHSATSQFFINVADNAFLDHTATSMQGWGYCVFGKVIEGTEVIDKIAAVKVGRKGFYDDVPVEDVVITTAELMA